MQKSLDPMSVQRTETPSASYVLRRRYGPARYVIAAASWLTVISLLFQPVAAWAETISWDGGDGSSNNWSAGGNWTGSPDNTAPVAGDDVLFYQAGAARLTTGVIDAGFTAAINSLTFGNSQSGTVTIGGTQALTINTGGIAVNSGFGAVNLSAPITLGASQAWANNGDNALTVGGTVTTAGFTLTVGGTGNTTITAPIIGAGGITKTGSGTVTVVSPASYGGTTVISSGTLKLNPNSVPGTPTLWFDANDPAGNGVLPANGATVATLVNKGSAASALNATSGAGPVFTASAMGPANLPVLRFNGTTQHLDINNAAMGTLHASPHSMFVVARR